MREGWAMFAITLVMICVFIGSLGQVTWKRGMSSMDKIEDIGDLLKLKTIFDIVSNKYIILGSAMYGFAFILWLAAMSTLDVSFMYPLLSLAYLITAIMAFVFLGENVSIMRLSGTVLIVMGCIIIIKS